jgi:hypothetical protein
MARQQLIRSPSQSAGIRRIEQSSLATYRRSDLSSPAKSGACGAATFGKDENAWHSPSGDYAKANESPTRTQRRCLGGLSKIRSFFMCHVHPFALVPEKTAASEVLHIPVLHKPHAQDSFGMLSVAPGSLATIFGTNLTLATASSNVTPYRTSLGGISISLSE